MLKNHVAIVLDSSGSMSHIAENMREVFVNQIEYLRKQSLQFEQETRVSVYLFNGSVKCIVSDTDVARPIKVDTIRCGGSTALLDATKLAIEDLQLLPQKYDDHAFIVYVLTDGEENTSKISRPQFKKFLRSLPENYTVACFAPNINAVKTLENLGFEKGNIDKWEATKRGIEEVGVKFAKTVDNYFDMRSKGIRSCSTVFSDLKDVSISEAKTILNKANPRDYKIVINENTKAIQIRPLVEEKIKKPYITGSAFYELVKNEHVQANKKIAIQNKKTGEVFAGQNARQLLNLPNMEVKITPEDHGEWIVYIQSNSVNRNVIPKQRVLVALKERVLS